MIRIPLEFRSFLSTFLDCHERNCQIRVLELPSGDQLTIHHNDAPRTYQMPPPPDTHFYKHSLVYWQWVGLAVDAIEWMASLHAREDEAHPMSLKTYLLTREPPF